MRRSSISRWKPIKNARWRSGRLRGGGVHRKSSTNALLATFALALPLDLYVARRHPPLRLNNISTLCLHSNHKNSDRGDPPPEPETQIHRSMNRTQRKREQVVWLCVSPEPNTDPLLLDHPSRRDGVDLCFATRKHRSTAME